jgi:hypothetical protein
MLGLLVLIFGGVLLLGLIGFVFKAIGLVLNLALLPLRILVGGVFALGGVLSLALMLPLFAIAGAFLTVGLVLGGLVLLAHLVF